jgi:hypothetical protein
MKKTLLALSIGLLYAGTLAAQNLSGTLSGNLGPGTYTVVGDIEVAAGTTLTISPGTTFQHNGHWYWNIYGTMIAIGTQADSIKWIRQQEIAEHRWGGLRFTMGTPASSLRYCVVDHAYIGSGTSTSMKGGGIFAWGITMTIAHCRISNNESIWGGGGIYAMNDYIVIDSCSITDNTASTNTNGGGVYFYNSFIASISHCIIARNTSTGG